MLRARNVALHIENILYTILYSILPKLANGTTILASTSSVDRIYGDVKRMASQFDFKPGEKLNEAVMAKNLGASRTPLREALNRLVSEGFITFEKGRGFFCRQLNASDILELYQAREAIECKLVELICTVAPTEHLENIRMALEQSAQLYSENTDCGELVKIDEQFHVELARLAGNGELLRMLENLNDRIRFIRTIDLDERRIVTPQDHIDILEAMIAGDRDLAFEKMRRHIERSSEQATEAVRKAYAHIYVPE